MIDWIVTHQIFATQIIFVLNSPLAIETTFVAINRDNGAMS